MKTERYKEEGKMTYNKNNLKITKIYNKIESWVVGKK